MKFLTALIVVAAAVSCWGADSTVINTSEDTGIRSGRFEVNYNYGASEFIVVEEGRALGDYRRFVFAFRDPYDSLPADVIVDSAHVLLYWFSCSNIAVPNDYLLYQMCKPIFEGNKNGATATTGETTYNDFYYADYEWGTAGAGAADDGCEMNMTDAGGYDRKATVAVTFDGVSCSTACAIGAFYGAVMDTILLHEDSLFFLLKSGTSGILSMSVDVGTWNKPGAGDPIQKFMPRLVVFHHDAPTGTSRRRKLLQIGESDAQETMCFAACSGAGSTNPCERPLCEWER